MAIDSLIGCSGGQYWRPGTTHCRYRSPTNSSRNH